MLFVFSVTLASASFLVDVSTTLNMTTCLRRVVACATPCVILRTNVKNLAGGLFYHIVKALFIPRQQLQDSSLRSRMTVKELLPFSH
jgi:hypothetical protein